jgi:endonuclease/exonuclease/phosphatase family metal-dependent hydrolase
MSKLPKSLFTSLVIFFMSWEALANFEIAAVTFNGGFLDRNILGVKRIYVPDYPTRLQHFEAQFEAYLQQNGRPAIIALQEMWDNCPAQVAKEFFEHQGYVSIERRLRSRVLRTSHHGLEIFILAEVFEVSNTNFHEIHRAMVEGAFSYRRGLMEVNLVHKPSGSSVYVATTHLTPLVGQLSTRTRQISDIITRVNSQPAEIKILLGDFNFSPDFSFSIADREQEGTPDQWRENGELLEQLLQATGMNDSYREVNESIGFTQDRVRNDLADFSPSTAYEPEQRIDYVLYKGSESKGCLTKSSKLIFDGPIVVDGEVQMSRENPEARLFLSDHFGVASLLSCEDL